MHSLLQTILSIKSPLAKAHACLDRVKESPRVKEGRAEFRKNWLVGLVAGLALSGLILLLGPVSDPDVAQICLVGLIGFMVWLDRRSMVFGLHDFIGRLLDLMRITATRLIPLSPRACSAIRSACLKKDTPPPRTEPAGALKQWVHISSYLSCSNTKFQ